MGTIRVALLSLTVVAACGKSDRGGRPSKVVLISSKPDATGKSVRIELGLRDRDDRPTTASGRLHLSVREPKPGEPVDTGDVCRTGSVEVTADRFTGRDPTWIGVAEWTAPCPAADHNREGILTFQPAGASPIHSIVEIDGVTLAKAPVGIGSGTGSGSGAGLGSAAPLQRGELVVTPFPVIIRASGATLARDTADPDAIVVHAARCDVRVATTTVTSIDKMRAKPGPAGEFFATLLASTNVAFIAREIDADSWILEYKSHHPKTPFGVHIGISRGDAIYMCRGDYAEAGDLGCGAAVCSTLRWP